MLLLKKLTTLTLLSTAPLLFFGCSAEKTEPTPVVQKIPSGPPKQWDIGDQVWKHKLPDDVSDGYLQFARTSSMSYGIMLSHDRISARSHSNSDMVVYIHSGSARFHVDDQEFTAATGDLVFIPRASVYSAENVSTRDLQWVTMYAPPLDSNDIVFHEAAERVKNVVPSLPQSPLLDTTLTITPRDGDKYFEQMKGSIPIDDKGDDK